MPQAKTAIDRSSTERIKEELELKLGLGLGGAAGKGERRGGRERGEEKEKGKGKEDCSEGEEVFDWQAQRSNALLAGTSVMQVPPILIPSAI